jgi:hypothetical protein
VVLTGDGAGGLSWADTYPLSARALALGDLTGDGRLDLVVADGAAVRVLANSGR